MENQNIGIGENLSVIVLGASGDLAKRKIYPSLLALFVGGKLPKATRIIGYARSELEQEAFIASLRGFIKEKNEEKVREFFALCVYRSGKYDQLVDYESLNTYLEAEEARQAPAHPANRLFYLSLPPAVFVQAAAGIGQACKSKQGWTRVVVEKPFGRDTRSFKELSVGLGQHFAPNQLYRIDHYIGKEVVQNLLVLRFANIIFDPLWNRSNISNVQIVFKEELGVEGRGGYFDQYGIIRDVMQNHLLQVLALIAMEPPVTLHADDIRNEKVKVLRSIEAVEAHDMVVGQYKGKTIAGESHPGYREDPTVPTDSTTPTFAACVLKIRNRRWDGVPFLLKCGKALDERKAEIIIQFHNTPGSLYDNNNGRSPSRNELVIRVQPNESIYFRINNKIPGLGTNLGESQLDINYKTKFGKHIPDAYERLILESMEGDESNFIREDELLASWEIFTPILQQLEKNKIRPAAYAFGSRGPVESDYLAAKYNVKWSEAETDSESSS